MMQTIPWKRILVEGTAIVASILLAFAIDAWWDERKDDAEAGILIDGMRADFEASQAHLDDWYRVVSHIYDANVQFLRLIESAELGSEIEIPFEVFAATLGAPTYGPTDSTLQTATASGDIDLIDDHDLLKAISVWRQQLADTSEDEILTRELVVERLVPELSKQVRLGTTFQFEPFMALVLDGPGNFPGKPVALTVTGELEGLLAQRLFYFQFVVDGLAEIQQTQASILELLETD